ncbi:MULTISPECIES: UDP-N-acetylglucosamine 1-carboxyvinyltransferase [Porcipelethomonas]|jgi:UDP-N-acetylglucosamine 1-carboxyvinyltransferase|uniref:UDP-N-acetylglucosamine 1-carboxyvinyltransferase n=1 Tax=Porcipelethomonas TaxID=2981643 RepID=UPI0008212A42|nr:UDP-N-acetylglucosamine 1-carboxyvinyltransferase [Porcipelethomonas ammoniilytica]MBS1324580.1 UDP-N-acetylglucosamine 1-carboxyvinyltransferase [Oscillospiraceae bacterium]MBS6314165.1 UDP-N-acetylglucosamine 1-carboxyvinyltransferase [Ruminococcus sp.]OLA72102.1 MAG: UDP-N-acetylglucosamine 1-carboxyvinyltransferase [Ruminococcus sp. 37_24]SCJ04790.1 UDP-N-acetylglucosamine 1-carboxyvinyltransferase 1 [uncultured Ruminococcus sp.]MCU6720198.1 UDP-N-acetylglucosamine 1-carboxyvinyltransfe
MKSQRLIIEGGNALSGEIKVQGAKNSSLPIIAASLMCKGETVLKNCPCLTDTYASCRILTHLGCTCRFEGNTLTIKPDGINKTEIPDELMREMRSSIIYMGALLGRCGKCGLSFPGGCELGPRPIDMHLSAMKKMGAKVNDEYGTIECTAEHGLKGTKIILKYPSVGTTENIILAAVMAKGETIIMNAAREPEIMDLAAFLNKCGGKIKGAGNSTIVIEGVNELFGCTHYIMPDRIAAATYISAAASTNGEISIHGIDPALCDSFMCVFEQMGCNIYVYDGCIYVNAKKPLKSVGKIITLPHPGFPTDAQAIIMASLCKANGISIFEETIFENRYRHVDSLVKMGADIKVIGKAAIITGVKKIYGAKVSATDLRGGAAMAVAGLGAEGITEITDVEHIDRGYENIEKVLTSMGGKITRA